VDVVDLLAHQTAQDPAAAVRRENSYGHHAGRRDSRTAGHGRVELVGARAADDLSVLDRDVHALGR
jgi:hypothetical protein